MRNTASHGYLWHGIEERLASIGSALKSHWVPVLGIIALLIGAAIVLAPRVIREYSQPTVSQSKPLTHADIARVTDLFKIQQPQTSIPYYLREPTKPSPLLSNMHR